MTSLSTKTSHSFPALLDPKFRDSPGPEFSFLKYFMFRKLSKFSIVGRRSTSEPSSTIMISKSLSDCEVREFRSSKSSSLRLKIATTMEMVGFKSENFSKILIHGRMRKAFMIIYKLKIDFVDSTTAM